MDDEERRVQAVIESHSFVPMSAEIARLAGRRIGERDVKTLEEQKRDAAIGASAEIEGEPVLTRHVGDLEALGFDVETY